MYPPSEVFTIFFVTLGPLKAMPVFFMLTREADQGARRYLALRSTLAATVIVLAVAVVILQLLAAWKISLPALQIAGGVLLFVYASLVILQIGQPTPRTAQAIPPGTPPDKRQLKSLALSPLAVPVIVTPFGLVAVLVFMGSAVGNYGAAAGVLGLLLLIMALNLVGMLVAGPVIGFVGTANLQILLWIMAILQAGLAVEAVLGALRKLGVLV